MTTSNSLTRVAFGSFGTAVCAAICLVGATAPAHAEEAMRTTQVQFHDLNLASAAGRAELDRRLLRAAHAVCNVNARTLDRVAAEQKCVAETLNSVRLPARAIVTRTADAG